MVLSAATTLLATFIVVAAVATPASAGLTDGFFVVTDVNGANDVPAQSDLTQMGRNDADATSYNIFWSWDSTDQWTGTGQTGDACALFDYNSNTKIDAVVCGQVNNPGADTSKVALTHAPFVFRCDDSKNDRCGQPSAQQPYTATDIAAGVLGSPVGSVDNGTFDARSLITATDPFDATKPNGPGSNYSNDASLQVNVKKTFLNGTLAGRLGAKYPVLTSPAVLVNVCSYPSAGNGGNNNPFDCITSPGSGFLVIVKNSGATTGTWNFGVGPAGALASGESSSYPLTTAGSPATVTSAAIPLLVGTDRTVGETQLDGWSLASATCAVNGSTTGTRAAGATTVTAVTIASGATTTCTFTNQRNTGSILVKKVDKDSTSTLLTGATFTATPTGGGTAVTLTESTSKPGYYCAAGFPMGDSYAIAETAAPTNYNAQSSIANVTVSVADSCATRIAATTPTADRTVEDTHKTGSVLVKKVADGTTTVLSGATFTATPSGGTAVTLTESTTYPGYYCADGLLTGTAYTIAETAAPAGYDPTTTAIGTVTPGENTCASRLTGATPAVDKTVGDPRKTTSIIVKKVVQGTSTVLAGAAFDLTLQGTATPIAMTEVSSGVFCVDGLPTSYAGHSQVYDVTESTAPNGYNGDANIASVTASTTASTCAARLAGTWVADRTVGNSPAPGTINISKVDDLGNALVAGFTLYVDDNQDGTHQSTETTVQAGETTTTGGSLSWTQIPLGYYCAVETTTPTGYATAAPQCRQVGLGASDGSGQTIGLTFTDNRTHRVVVLVCHEGSDTLDPSDVTVGGVTKSSIGAGSLTAAQQKALCDTGGATFSGLGHAPVTVSVTPGH